ncbi:MAG: hypothetical protein EBW55_02430 [Betaproteobacteria bacterium]|nr:hypothetical protein [Betaproteobacteria bacterium]NCV69571.1 hypothetical protein [Betaproteobacteria bacterium]NDF51912.1 hypothetical protein [Betaproteobacteria bacterium]
MNASIGPSTAVIQGTVVEQLKAMGPFTHAVTVTFKRYEPRHCCCLREEFIEPTARHMLRRINQRWFGHAHHRYGKRIAAVVVCAAAHKRQHPHLHLAVQCPKHCSPEMFCEFIDQAADATDWIHKHRIIKDYIDDGWIHYMTRAEHVVLWDLCHPASD